MNNKKIIALIVLGILAAVSLFYGITAPPKKRPAAAPSPGISQPAKSVPLVSRTAVTRRSARTRFITWKKSPFVPPEVPGETSKLVLNGIIGGRTPKAMIGDNMVGVGDTVGKSTVIAIKDDRVVLNDGKKDFELVLKQ